MRIVLSAFHAFRKLRQKLSKEPQLICFLQLLRMFGEKKLLQLYTNSLCTDLLKIRGQKADSLPGILVNPIVQLCGKPDRTHHSKRILCKALHRIAYSAYDPPIDISDTVEFIDQTFCRTVCHCIDRKIPPFQILQETCGKRDMLRVTPIRIFSINPVSCHLIARAIHHHRHSPVLNSGIHRSAEYPLGVLRLCRRCNVPVIRHPVKEAVAHAASDHICLISRIPKLLQNPCCSLRNFYFQ